MAADIKQAFGTATAFTLTNLNSLASSATAGWQSNVIDNSTNLFDDALVITDWAFGAGTPANSKGVFLYAFGLVDASGSEFTSTGDGAPGASEGTLTFPDITTTPIVAPLLGVVPINAASKTYRGGPFSIARCFGGVLPPKWKIGIVNHSGIALPSTATVKYIEVKYQVV